MTAPQWDASTLQIATQIENAAIPPLDAWEALPWKARLEPDSVPAEVAGSMDWRPAPLGMKMPGPAAWYRTVFVVPERVAGFESRGPITLQLGTSQAHVDVFVDGRKRGRVHLNDELRIADAAGPGDRFEIHLYGDVMKDWMTLKDARWRLDFVRGALERMQDCAWSLRCGVHILRADTFRRGLYTNQAVGENRFPEPRERLGKLRLELSRAAEIFDLDALRAQDRERFLLSQERAVEAMKNVADFAKEWTFFLIGHSHLDLAWKWRRAEAVECGRETIRMQIENMKLHPGFVFVESSPALWEEIKKRDPDLFAEMKEMAGRGQFEPVGATWLENDAVQISEESWARHFLYAEKFAREEFGAAFTCGFNIDAFGYNQSIPMLFKDAGVGAFLTQKLRYNDTNLFPHVLFRWRSPDGSEILGIHVVPDHYQELYAEEMAITVKEFGAATGIKDIPVLFGVGNHGGGPLPIMFRRLERLAGLPIFPRFKFSSLGGYLKHLRENWELSGLPFHDDELYLETHRKTFTTQDQAKRGNRELEVILTDTEKLMAMAALEGLPLPQDGLESAWKKTLFNHFHDILPGTSIPSVYQDMREDYAAAREEAGRLQDRAARHLMAGLDTASLARGLPFAVFNTLAWRRTDVAEIPLNRDVFERLARKSESWDRIEAEALEGNLAVADPEGRLAPCQWIQEEDGPRLIFLAADIPAMGCKAFSLVRRKRSNRVGAGRKAGKTFLENARLRVEVDLSTGNVRRIYDKARGHEALAHGAQANELQLLEEKSSVFRAWNIGYTGREFRAGPPESIELVEHGPVRSIVRVKRSFYGETKKKYYTSYFWITPACDYPSSFFEQDIILYADSERVDFRLRADWWEDNLLLKAAFPLSVWPGVSASDMPYSFIERSSRRETGHEKARDEVFTLKWTDLSDGASGVSFLNRTKHGYDVLENVYRLTLLTSPEEYNPHSVPDILCDRGRRDIRYALWPHDGGWRVAGTPRRAWEYNTPLLCFRTDRHDGPWGTERGWLEVDAGNVIVTGFKPALEGEGIVVRAYEAAGRETTAALRLGAEGWTARPSNLTEKTDPGAKGVSPASWRFGPYQMKTWRVEPPRPTS